MKFRGQKDKWIILLVSFCRLFKDVQIETFVKLMDSEDLGHMLAQCEVVREFRWKYTNQIIISYLY